jgi:hypothetical protein
MYTASPRITIFQEVAKNHVVSSCRKNALGLFPGDFPGDFPAPLTMTKLVQTAVESIFETLGSECSSEGKAALTSPSKMQRIAKWLKKSNLQLIIENDKVNRQIATARAIKLLKEGFPVIISKEGGESLYHHYSVATRLRQRTYRYRDCKITTCSPWHTVVESEVYVHLGVGKKGNKWENVDTHFTAAILKQ